MPRPACDVAAVKDRERSHPLLLADIGGTHARFLLAHASEPPSAVLPPENRLDLRAENFDSFEDLVATALDEFELPRSSSPDVVLAVAAPVDGNRVRFTNRPWLIDSDALCDAFSFRSVQLLNDLAAAARALSGRMRPHDFIQEGEAGARQRQVLISVGTGLGAAFWSTREEGGVTVDASEAGHAGFAPVATWQLEWLQELKLEHERVSWERVLSGAGLAALDAWLRQGERDEPRNVVERAHAGSGSARRAANRFSELLGVFAGDLVLAAPAQGGVWLGGGVLRGLDALFDRQAFLDGFHAKGRMSERMRNVPVRWTRDADLGLLGSWLTAASMRRERAREAGAAVK